MSLEDMRRQNKPPQRNIAKVAGTAGKNIGKVAGTNFTKVTGKKFPGTKLVRFPDSYTPRDTIISNNSSTTNNSSDSDMEELEPNEEGMHLPNFMQSLIPQVNPVEDDSDSDSDQPQSIPEFRGMEQAQLSSSDSDSDSPVKQAGPFGDEDNKPPKQTFKGDEVYREGSQSPPEALESTTDQKDQKDPYTERSESRQPSSESTSDAPSKPPMTDENPARPSERRTSLGSGRLSEQRPSIPFIGRRPSVRSRPSNETDITDQTNRSRGRKSSTEESLTAGAFKSILRKMSLADQAYTTGFVPDEEKPSTSDSFLGRVLNFSKDSGPGLSGGGLAPGASRGLRDRELDEEEKVGMRPETIAEEDPDAIEMKPIGFDELDPEAQKLITSHIPESEAAAIEAHHELEGEPLTETLTEAQDDFYAPNPDIFLRREALNEADPGDDFLLDDDMGDGYVAPPKKVHAGVLSSLLKLYQNPAESKSANTLLSKSSGGGTTLMEEAEEDYDNWQKENMPHERHGVAEFNKLKKGIMKAPKKVTSRIKGHGGGGGGGGGEGGSDGGLDNEKSEGYIGHEANALPSFLNARPKQPKKIPNPSKKAAKLKKNRRANQLRITVHISDILQRQRFIMRMCRALMLFGAPTHRLEEYMIMTSRVLEIDGQFIYFPGCMIVAFGDAATRTSEVHLVRCAQGVNLSKLSDTHRIYKAVIHDYIGVEEAARDLDELLRKKNLYPPWLCVFFYGLGSAMVCPYAFGGGWIDLPIAFGVGLCVGYLQFIVSAMLNLYSSVFEVTASIVVAFIARAIGSIRGGSLFCFSAVAQGSLALILPGYIILTGSLELQSRNLVAGSVRMFYAIIYSLFLGFGITLGGALYGWVDKNAVSANSCGAHHTTDDKFRILFVPMFSLCLGLINQARWQQLPVMIVISCTGYIGTYFAGKHFSLVTEFTACIGAFIVGILGNLYSRIWKGMAVSAMLPAIFVQVPSGIASQSSLVSGIQNADQITHSNSTLSSGGLSTSSSSMSFGTAMVEVSIGISVGLFAAALVVYPFGKKGTGLFTL